MKLPALATAGKILTTIVTSPPPTFRENTEMVAEVAGSLAYVQYQAYICVHIRSANTEIPLGWNYLLRL